MLIALIAPSLTAQPREGRNIELSLSGSYQNISFGEDSKSSGAFLISPRVGFFVVKGLELEPEILLMAGSGESPVYVLNGLISYNFLSVAGKGVPFLLVGYGIANTTPFFNVPMVQHDFTVSVLNLGGGVKAFLTEDVALRFEYRFQKFSGQGERGYGPYTWTSEVNTQIHTVQFGFSILL